MHDAGVQPPVLASVLLADIAERIRIERARRQLTQEELAHRAAISRVHLGAIERGEVSCSVTVLAQIAMALGISMHALLPGETSAASSRRLR